MKTNVKPVRPKFAKKNRETILPSKLAQLINDFIAILLFALAAMLALALATHSVNDSCWSKTIDNPIVYNKLGVVGAYLSDILLYVFGFSAWWVVIGIFFLGFRKISRHKIEAGNWISIIRSVSFLFLILGSTTFEYISFFHQSTTLPDGFGGSVGAFIFNTSFRLVGEAGVSVISLADIVVSFSLSFGISWLSIAEKIGAGLEAVYLRLSQLVARKPSVGMIEDDGSEEVEHSQAAAEANFKLNSQGMPKVMLSEFAPEPAVAEEHELSIDLDQVKYNLPEDDDQALELVTPFLANDEYADEPLHSYEPTASTFKPEIEEGKQLRPQLMPKLTPLRNIDLLASASQAALPSTSLLNLSKSQTAGVSPETIEYVSKTIQATLAEFGVEVTICNVESGPVITRYELVPPRGVRGDKIAGLAKEIARALALSNIRIVETIPGKNTMGIEVPNFKRQVIYLKEIFDATVYERNSSLLTLALGKDIAGEVIVTDLAKMPHLLVAGTTGSGKSVAVNAMILSILFKATPEQVKFIMIDPKMVELSFYEDIPHLLAPVVTDMSQAANALKWTVGEMEQRYKIMAKIGTKNIISYNQKIEASINEGNPYYNPFSPNLEEPEPLTKWPYIVVIIDELADLMMVAGKKIEQYIARIAQKARAVGIHLIVATQRPSVDVITGLIKANIPARISFQVSSKIDSRTILDQMGAETLLGQGDMLFLNPGSGFPRRIHGAYVNDDELHNVVEFLKQQGAPDYNDDILNGASEVLIPGFEEDSNSGDGQNVEKDSVFDEAVKYILDTKRCSISSLQTQFGIGYNKAARIMNHLEKIGMVRRNERGTFELINHMAT
jgi:S-DNA-T family DNA segregation ATPase FtsK/SpoIIIE